MESIYDVLNLEGFSHAFAVSFAMILATELGDRTFFIAAIMAMRYDRLTVLLGALGALVVMTVLSCVFGLTAIAFLPQFYVHYTVVGLMFFFGVQLLRNGLKMKKAGFEELEEVEQEYETDDMEKGRYELRKSFQAVALQAFTLTFLAEWGDRSQLATIALAADFSVVGVCVGGIVGHTLCTGIAVVGGRMLANYVSERTVTLAGGTLFLLFGLAALLNGYEEHTPAVAASVSTPMAAALSESVEAVSG